MKPSTKPLLNLTAGDLMNAVVIAIPRQMSLAGAAHLLSQNRITGAPVVDDAGRCVGVVSATDFVHLAGGDRIAPREPTGYYCSEWQEPPGAAEAHDTVGQVMTANPVTALVSMPIGQLAQKMLDVHIHRIIIVNDIDHPIGVVSTTDILAAVARSNMLRVETSRERTDPVGAA